jgi:hypothetical protein
LKKTLEFLAGSRESLNQSGGADKAATAGAETKDGEHDLVGVTGSMVESSSEQLSLPCHHWSRLKGWQDSVDAAKYSPTYAQSTKCIDQELKLPHADDAGLA